MKIQTTSDDSLVDFEVLYTNCTMCESFIKLIDTVVIAKAYLCQSCAKRYERGFYSVTDIKHKILEKNGES